MVNENLSRDAIRETIAYLDEGKLRTAEPTESGVWQVNEWVKKAILLYFRIQEMQTYEVGPLEFHDSMVDTWATVGSCAQIGRNVHLAGGVGIGGVLEPPQASPTIIEDNCFIGSLCIVVEGVRVKKEAVLVANVVLTQSTHIIDVTRPEPITYKGEIPERSVVIPGSYSKSFPAGTYNVNCALIIGTRKESTDKKVSLNDALRDYSVAV
ncbi:MAG: 2,3,4,5-tetrahydropyridine-2,6-dicarboxylate N-succinyltransferase [Saprospiraceae bacterium]|nr:2,3,4,5-tetrahydropyridine-2,6-dicarboxylate N-succinyltransferase [Saprospiraceae bacterium]